MDRVVAGAAQLRPLRLEGRGVAGEEARRLEDDDAVRDAPAAVASLEAVDVAAEGGELNRSRAVARAICCSAASR